MVSVNVHESGKICKNASNLAYRRMRDFAAHFSDYGKERLWIYQIRAIVGSKTDPMRPKDDYKINPGKNRIRWFSGLNYRRDRH